VFVLTAAKSQTKVGWVAATPFPATIRAMALACCTLPAIGSFRTSIASPAPRKADEKAGRHLKVANGVPAFARLAPQPTGRFPPPVAVHVPLYDVVLLP